MTKTWKKQSEGGLFACWGKGSSKGENSLVFDIDQPLQGIVKDIKPSPTYGTIWTLATKEHESDVIVLGTTVLIKNMGYERDDKGILLPEEMQSSGYTVKHGDEIRITFKGTKKNSKGKDTFLMDVEVNR